jgi:hypothetical protein
VWTKCLPYGDAENELKQVSRNPKAVSASELARVQARFRAYSEMRVANKRCEELPAQSGSLCKDILVLAITNDQHPVVRQ